jgi:hypothetical protein
MPSANSGNVRIKKLNMPMCMSHSRARSYENTFQTHVQNPMSSKNGAASSTSCRAMRVFMWWSNQADMLFIDTPPSIPMIPCFSVPRQQNLRMIYMCNNFTGFAGYSPPYREYIFG